MGFIFLTKLVKMPVLAPKSEFELSTLET